VHPLGHEVHPQPEQESILGQFLLGGLDFWDVFRRSLRATTKKRSSAFFDKKKCTTQTKSWLRLWSRDMKTVTASRVASPRFVIGSLGHFFSEREHTQSIDPPPSELMDTTWRVSCNRCNEHQGVVTSVARCNHMLFT